jgi:hypothetical protein
MPTTPRFGLLPNDDNTGRTQTYDYQTPAYAATIAIIATQGDTIVAPAQLTGNLTLSINASTSAIAPYAGDKILFLFNNNNTTCTVTFGTGFSPNGTLSNTASYLSACAFVYNGTTWQELYRSTVA